MQGASHWRAAPLGGCRGAGASRAGCGGVCGTGRGGTRAYGQQCSSHSTASNTATAHLSVQAADVLQFANTHTHTAYICLDSTSKHTAAPLNTKHRGAGLTPTSEFVVQRFSELSVQADQTPCCTRFSLQPRVALQIPETKQRSRSEYFSMVNSHFHVSTKLRLSESWIQRLLPVTDAYPLSPVSRGKIQGLNKFTILLCRSCRAVMKNKSISDQTCLN